MKNILITGANGQLGSELQKLFPLHPYYHYFSTDVDTLNLCNKNEVASYFAQTQPDYIINCAAYTAVDRAEDDRELCYAVNRDAVRNLAEAARGKAKIIHISTDYVFDGTKKFPLNELDTPNPTSIYGKSKLEGEQVLEEILPENMIIRTAWLYSSFGNNFVKTMIRLGKEKESLNVVSDQIGTPTYAADLAGTILDIIDRCENENTFPAGIYHYSNEGFCSWHDFCVKIFELTGLKCKVNPIPTSAYPTKASRPMYSVLDKTKIKTIFGLEIPKWEDSLKKCIEIFEFS